MIPGNTSSQGKYVDPPTSVSASISGTTATVSFTLPAYDGKGNATYSVASTPGGLTASGASSPLTVTGLVYSTSYTFIVTAISTYGISTASIASSAVSTGSAPVVPTPAPVVPTPSPVVPTPVEPAPVVPTPVEPAPVVPTPAPVVPPVVCGFCPGETPYCFNNQAPCYG